MGASAALLALPETDALEALVLDSPYVDLSTMIMDYYRILPLVDRFLALCTGLLARAVFGVWPEDVSPGHAVRGSGVPILLIHGAADRTIPAHHFELLQATLADNRSAEFWLVDGADHTLTYSLHRDAYQARVLQFFRRWLREVPPLAEAARPDPERGLGGPDPGMESVTQLETRNTKLARGGDA